MSAPYGLARLCTVVVKAPLCWRIVAGLAAVPLGVKVLASGAVLMIASRVAILARDERARTKK